MSEFWDKVKDTARGIWRANHGTGHPIDATPKRKSPIDIRAGLRNWFHAQRRLPPRIHTLPPQYQLMADKFNNRLMAWRENHNQTQKPIHATPYFNPIHRDSQR